MIDKYQLILLAAGKGERMCLPLNKIYYRVKNKKKTILDYSIEKFLLDDRCEKIVIVYNVDDEILLSETLSKYTDKRICQCVGGLTRQESVLKGLKYIDSKYVLVHDGARPNVAMFIVDELLFNLSIYDCCSPGVRVHDTIKKVSTKVETVDRSNLYYVQTPQGARVDVLKEALIYAKENNIAVTDDLQAIECLQKYRIKITSGDKNNLKITTKDDLLMMEYLLECKK